MSELSNAVKLVVTTITEIVSAKPAALTPAEIEAKRQEFLKLGTNMTLQQQCEEMKKHASTPMTYAEMRERFG
jgi:hypothetical protein